MNSGVALLSAHWLWAIPRSGRGDRTKTDAETSRLDARGGFQTSYWADDRNAPRLKRPALCGRSLMGRA
eukprot:3612043-Pyramimonas_sp.AAC.1